MLTEDAAIAMPPLASWFGGTHDAFREFLTLWPMNGQWRWKAVQTQANGQPALGFYSWNDETGDYQPFALNVLTFRGDKVSDVVAFANRAIDATDRKAYERWPEEALDEGRMLAAFDRFGLPGTLS